MTVDNYFNRLRRQIDTCPAVISTILAFEHRDHSRGYVRGEVYFDDGSVLHVREFIKNVSRIERQTYAYQYLDADQRMIFRYDNADHYPSLANAPHHKHVGSEHRVESSTAPVLADVLNEVEAIIRFGGQSVSRDKGVT